MVKLAATAKTPTLAAGNDDIRGGFSLESLMRHPSGFTLSAMLNVPKRHHAGFTLIELLVVMALVAVGSSLVVLSLRDSPQQLLNQEADRLVAVLENAKAQARSNSTPMVWRADAKGFSLRSLTDQSKPLQSMTWLQPGTQVQPSEWVIRAEPIQAPVQFQLTRNTGSLTLKSDGVQAFKVQP